MQRLKFIPIIFIETSYMSENSPAIFEKRNDNDEKGFTVFFFNKNDDHNENSNENKTTKKFQTNEINICINANNKK